MAPQPTRGRRIPLSLVPARTTRLVAIIAGIAGLLLCVLTPLLPVRQTTATIAWPQAVGSDGLITDVTAPLVSGAPLALDASIPCLAVATLPETGGLVFSTIPSGGIDASRYGLFVRANADTVVVAFRDSVAAVAPRPAVESGACSTLHLWANAGSVGADFVGIPGATGTVPIEKKPQVVGVFTDLKVAAQPGLSARIDVDTRFITAPTVLKTVLMALGVLATLASVVALAMLDRRAGRRVPHAWRRFWRAGLATWLADAVVVGTLVLWHVIGAISSDDGYNLAIARVSADAGYIANYYRYFGAAEAPFDWYQSVLAHLAAISTAGVWMRLPATAGRHRDLGAVVALGHPAPRPQAGAEPGRGVDRWRGVPGQLVAVQQRPAPRTADRLRRPADLGADGVRDRHPPVVAGLRGPRRRGVQRDARATGHDRAGPAAGRRSRRRRS